LLDHGCEPREDLARTLLADGALEHLAGVGDAAVADVAALVRALDRLALDRLGVLRPDVARAGHLDRELLDRLVGQLLEDVGGRFRADGDEEDGRLLAAGKRRYSFIHCVTWVATCCGWLRAISS